MMKRSNNRWCALQPELGLGMVWRSAVESLCRFKPELFNVAGEFKGGGELMAIGYEAWLRFYTPLCERGQS